ncbi:MAG: DUF3883 domain-containing protein [Caulobacterales bacterium]|jgi:hypothetical protein|nr:DUF3883 domain-containing protein [Caulobacterales bacterium]
MADEEKIGRPWDDAELDAIVEDYFAMLSAELAGRAYVKSHHSAALMERIGRTHRSVEFKHQNISAVLDELGLPWIAGYKPKRNYQNAIFDAIDRYLSAHLEVGATQVIGTASNVIHPAEPAFFVPPPSLDAKMERPPRLEKLVRKFDPVERDFRNRALGKAGEAFVVTTEKARLAVAGREDLADKVRWVADLDGDGAGYDVRSYEPSGEERLIEVKTTNGGARTPFFLTRNEHDMSQACADQWRLYRVHLFAQKPSVFTLTPPLAQVVHLRAETWRASFQ